MSVTTKTGDTGFASVRDGRFRKDSPVFAVLGALDELNCWIGTIRGGELRRVDGAAETAEEVQREIIALSGDVAGYGEFRSGLIARLERDIVELSPKGEFRLVLPAGFTHVARATCRRAERELVAHSPEHEGVRFLNRLSDWLYVMALAGEEEEKKR